MISRKVATLTAGLILGYVLLCVAPEQALAHCDGLDGPVVLAAKQALEKGNVNLVLIWVSPAAEAEVKGAFEKVLAVRRLGPQAKELADWHFFETVVRLHRAGEGEPYTGLKPAGRDLGPAIPAADKAIETGSAKPLLELIEHAIHAGLEERLHRVLVKRRYTPDEVPAGREFVADYVEWVHYVEGLYQAAAKAAHGHGHEMSNATEPHAH